MGLSDHSLGSTAAVAAVALGAVVVEKHFTTDQNLPGPDQKASTSPQEFSVLVQEVKRAGVMLGQPQKTLQREETAIRDQVRKSLVTARPLAQGHRLVGADLVCKRPGTGLAPGQLTTVLGQTLNRDLPQDHMLTREDLKGL